MNWSTTKSVVRFTGTIVSCLAIMLGIVAFQEVHGIKGTALGFIALIGGSCIFAVACFVTRRKPHTK